MTFYVWTGRPTPNRLARDVRHGYRPATSEDITDEIVERAEVAWVRSAGDEAMRDALVAALCGGAPA